MNSQQVNATADITSLLDAALDMASNDAGDTLSRQLRHPPLAIVDLRDPLPSSWPISSGVEPLNIVILGASFGGLSCAHHFLDYTITHLGKTSSAVTDYRLVIISPSTHIYWNIGAPRALVSPEFIKHEKRFISIEPGIHRYRGLNVVTAQGSCLGMDISIRIITVELICETAQRCMSQISKWRSVAMATSFASGSSANPRIQRVP